MRRRAVAGFIVIGRCGCGWTRFGRRSRWSDSRLDAVHRRTSRNHLLGTRCRACLSVGPRARQGGSSEAQIGLLTASHSLALAPSVPALPRRSTVSSWGPRTSRCLGRMACGCALRSSWSGAQLYRDEVEAAWPCSCDRGSQIPRSGGSSSGRRAAGGPQVSLARRRSYWIT